MRLRFLLAFLFVQILTIKAALGRVHNKTKTDNLKKDDFKEKYIVDHRNKRSLDDNEKSFWSHKWKRLSISENNWRLKNDKERDPKLANNHADKEPPFWGTRGRRDSTSIENYFDDDGPLNSKDNIFSATNCKHCDRFPANNLHDDSQNLKERREEQNVPFWGNRGRRSSEETDFSNYPFWESRERRQEEDPFWGARGRREDKVPFWGNRGRRYNLGKHDDVEKPPFWGNRGRRDEVEPFWGSRGRRQEEEPFWGSRGRREIKNIRREGLKKVLQEAINTVEDSIESLTRSKKDGNYALDSFWGSRGRESKLSNSFKLGRQRYQYQKFLDDTALKKSKTMQEDRMFAEQPHFVLVERSSRSSGEDDPYYISRGKKFFINDINDVTPHSNRLRRGSLEELVKSVRNDPYYIARGKKMAPNNSVENSTLSSKEIENVKELICATIDLILFNKGTKTKREVDDSDRDRRTILKKLAAQLQEDPYFVSRGKKNESIINEDNLEDFINQVSVKCN